METAGRVNRRSFLVGLGALVASPYLVNVKADAKVYVAPPRAIRVARASTFSDLSRRLAGKEIEIQARWKAVADDYEVPMPTARYNVRWTTPKPQNIVLSPCDS